MCAWRTKAIKGIVYFGWNVNGRLEELQEEGLYFRKAMEMEVLEKLGGYGVE